MQPAFPAGTASATRMSSPRTLLHVQEHPHIKFESRGSGDGLALRATTRIDRYAFGLTKKKGLAARYLDLEITAQATRS